METETISGQVTVATALRIVGHSTVSLAVLRAGDEEHRDSLEGLFASLGADIVDFEGDGMHALKSTGTCVITPASLQVNVPGRLRLMFPWSDLDEWWSTSALTGEAVYLGLTSWEEFPDLPANVWPGEFEDLNVSTKLPPMPYLRLDPILA